MKKVLVVLLLCVGTLAFSQETALLRLNYEKGDTYEVKTVMKQSMGEFMKMDMTMSMDLNVTDAKDNAIISEATFSHVKMDMESMGQKMDYDSNTEESELSPFGKGMHVEMKKLLETVVTIENDKLGNVTKTDIKSGIADISSFKDNMSGMIFPEEAVEVGYKWNETKEQEGMNIETTYEVASITDDTVELKVTGNVSGAAKGTLEGSSSVDRATGNVIKSEVNMSVTAEGQAIETSVVMTSTKK
ncbi:DUF6263 family protein [Winogradskyella algicola]|uniref:DUF6263 family protein n=1 Tax=Winogradskyella algicola TaxID=2575815 RepID=UPI0011091393|nr:DUF6263 family protein [Winogradskyella algicola]